MRFQEVRVHGYPPLNPFDFARRIGQIYHQAPPLIPPNLVHDWLLPDGSARVQALPKGDPNDTNVLRTFATAVLRAEPTAIGAATSYYESAKTVTNAFVEAGVLALGAIAVLLLIALRRVTDVLLTLIPLLLAGVVTLEICVLDGLTLNFANIIALPCCSA